MNTAWQRDHDQDKLLYFSGWVFIIQQGWIFDGQKS
jgi:hypothetical protein